MKGIQYQFISVFLLLTGFVITGMSWGIDNSAAEDVNLNQGHTGAAVKQKPAKAEIPDIAPVDNQTYTTECGSCHFPFQPGLLPVKSWEMLMASLDDHFGENAEFAITERNQIKEYLVSNAAEKSHYALPIKMLDFMMTNDAQKRITKNMYIAYEHRSIPKKMLQENPRVKSLSQCNVCHIRAEKGVYAEAEVVIPGFGKWKPKIMH